MNHAPALNKFGFVDYREELNQLYLKVKKISQSKTIGQNISNSLSAWDWICEIHSEMKSKGIKITSDKDTYDYILKNY